MEDYIEAHKFSNNHMEQLKKDKKCRLFLIISFIVFILSVIIIISSLFISYYKIKADFPNDYIKVMEEFGFGLIVTFFIILPFWGTELSFIRSAYKILKHKPQGTIKICYIISSILSLFAAAFFCFAYFGLIKFIGEGGRDNTAQILLFTMWPLFLISFVLGTINNNFK